MFSFDELLEHPEYQALPEDKKNSVAARYVDTQWSQVTAHPDYEELDDQRRETLRTNFLKQFYGDALEAPDEVYHPLAPAGPAQSVLEPIESKPLVEPEPIEGPQRTFAGTDRKSVV